MQPAFGGAASSPDEGGEVTLSQEDLESVAVLFGAIKALLAPTDKAEVDQLTAAFDSHMTLVLNRLNQRLSLLGDNKFRRQAETLMAKHGLYDICFQEAINYSSVVSPRLSAVLRKLRLVHTTLFQSFPPLMTELQDKAMADVDKAKRQAEEAEHETAQLLQAAEMLEKEIQQQQQELARCRHRLDQALKEKEAMQNLHFRRTPSKRPGADVPGEQKPTERVVAKGRQTKYNTESGAGSPASADPASSGGRSPLCSGPGDLHNITDPLVSPGSIRNLSLKQLKEMINLMYASKERHDKKCVEARLPRETMEQHMYTFMSQRYGLKHLTVENASAMIKAVEKYASLDNDIAVFGKILRNEIDEEFVLVQKQLREAVVDLLRVHVREKNPLKGDEIISNMVQQKLQGTLQEEEWMDIVQYMYNNDDSLALMVLIKDLIWQRRQDEERKGEVLKGRPRSQLRDASAENAVLAFGDFLKVLLDWQLHGHENFLSRVREGFRKVDSDRDGIVSESELLKLVQTLSPDKTQKQLQTLLEKMNPYDNIQRFTFSEVVSSLADIVASSQIEQIHPNAAIH